MTGVLIRKYEGKRTHREEDYEKIEAETGLMQPQAKEHQEPPEARRGKEKVFPRVFGGR